MAIPHRLYGRVHDMGRRLEAESDRVADIEIPDLHAPGLNRAGLRHDIPYSVGKPMHPGGDGYVPTAFCGVFHVSEVPWPILHVRRQSIGWRAIRAGRHGSSLGRRGYRVTFTLAARHRTRPIDGLKPVTH